MAEAAAADQGSETIPNDLIFTELERALHQAVSENVLLRARIAMRDRQAAVAMPATPVPVPVPVVTERDPEASL